MSDKTSDKYTYGADFWRDNVASYGVDEAVGICNRYLDTILKREHSDAERWFCREIFVAMYEATADKIIPVKLVYPYDFKKANDRAETSYFHKNQELNQGCAGVIDEAISASNYQTNFYNLELATMSVVSGQGFERVSAILAHHIQKHEYDGRYSDANKKWAKEFILPEHTYTFMRSHAILIDGLATHVCKLYKYLEAEQNELPGREEHGEFVHGYEIIRSIMISKNCGYAIDYNPDAPDKYVCWQFTLNKGQRDYNWGIYGDEKAAVDGYNARLFVAYN